MYKDETWLNADIIKYNDLSIAQGMNSFCALKRMQIDLSYLLSQM